MNLSIVEEQCLSVVDNEGGKKWNLRDNVTVQ